MSTYTPDQLATILADHRAWLLGQKGIEARADLSGADLRGADLRGADLRGADLTRAVLTYAVLRDADLTGADLTGADLRGADLRGADLPAGYRWEAYLAEVVPALLTAGGKSLADVLAALRARGGWAACHSWGNCPLHEAFGADGLSGIPQLYRGEAAQFVQFFDAGLIPEPALPDALAALDQEAPRG